MLNSFLGKKIGQSQKFDEKGKRYPVTQIEADPCVVVQIKTVEKDGYQSYQLGFGTKKEINITKPLISKFRKAEVQQNPRFLREIRVNTSEKTEDLKTGDQIKIAQVFQAGDIVNIIGTSKGKGFAGGVKRHHFKGGPRTHGQSDRERAPGSIGSTTTPGRVLKGKRMAGHLGADQVTVKNLPIMEIDSEKNLLTVKGLVPGGKNGLLVITKVGFVNSNKKPANIESTEAKNEGTENKEEQNGVTN